MSFKDETVFLYDSGWQSLSLSRTLSFYRDVMYSNSADVSQIIYPTCQSVHKMDDIQCFSEALMFMQDSKNPSVLSNLERLELQRKALHNKDSTNRGKTA